MSVKIRKRWKLLSFALIMLFALIIMSAPINATNLLIDSQKISCNQVDNCEPDILNIVEELSLSEKLLNGEVILKIAEVESNFEGHSINSIAAEEMSGVASKSLSPIDVKLILAYDKSVNVLHVALTISAADLLKYATAKFETTGPMGNSEIVIHGTNFIPSPIMTLNWSYSGINLPHYLQAQFVKVTGTVTGVFGYGSFGPTTSGVGVG